MEVVAPLRVHAVAVRLAWAHKLRIVEVAFGDEDEPATDRRADALDLRRELLHEVHGRAVDELVRGVQAETIDVVVLQPHEGVVAEEPADLIASALVEVDRSAPRRVVTLRKVGRKLVRVIPYRAEVVVDHVEDHSKVLGVAGIDEALESIGTAIGLERREEE